MLCLAADFNILHGSFLYCEASSSQIQPLKGFERIVANTEVTQRG
jgi:hypothetical protein